MKRILFLLTSIALLLSACAPLPKFSNATSSPTPLPQPTLDPGYTQDAPSTATPFDPAPPSGTSQGRPVSVSNELIPADEADTYWVVNPSSGSRLFVRVAYPRGWNGELIPALVLVPGGTGTTEPRKAEALAAEGFLVIIFDPEGRGRSEGTEDYNGFIGQDGLAAVIEAATALPGLDANRYGLVSYSYGVTLATGALARHPELVNAVAEDGFQPLGLACFFGHLEAADYLVAVGASINLPSNNELHATPLQSAVAGGHASIVKILLKNGAQPNVRERGGFTPLHIASANGDVESIQLLILAGADLHLRSNDDKLPLHLAEEKGHARAAEILKREITKRFRAAAAKP